ncbi:DUF2062 domain-containing protein [Bacteroides sp. 519]|uniref:DUF2062 domain-containing protein n=1 Tax=Bacteroides sp. 519 TaxID=2302937 RepID=UPI0013D0B81F|nr:DUF2062 domain-containing protein [Bacteroides sp. 519]NDV60703.1 DUF2062 domain-containing protein [Bacteroides sp. 519]
MTDKEAEYWQAQTTQLNIVIVIPTYNNAATLETVIYKVSRYANNIVVVNDGSTDDTKQILTAYSTIKVITHPTNKGKGAALKTGLTYAREEGYRYAITIDSDGQHFASDIPLFIQEIEKEPDSLLIGARNLEANNMPGKNTFANKFSNFWYRLETGIKLQDTQSGYRLYPLQKMGSMKRYTARYEFELEAIVLAAWRGINVKNILINVYYPPEGERISHFRPFRDFTRISILNTILVLVAFLWIWPRNFFRKLTWKNIKNFFHKHITHSPDSNTRLTLSIMLGVFMGIVPLWGYQMLITLFLSRIFKLNTVIAILAANISIPPMIPLLLYGSYATGCLVLGRPIAIDFGDVSLENIKTVLEQYLVGSFLFAALSSIVAGLISWCAFSIFRRKNFAS